MKTDTISKVCRHIIDDYRFTFHSQFDGEAGLLEIELREKNTFLWTSYKWKRIYFGHSTPIEEALKFFNENIKQKM